MSGIGSENAPGFNIPAGTPGANTMRTAFSVPPILAANNIPTVKSTVGLGTGGGASCQVPSNGGFGTVQVFCGIGALANGNVDLSFPSTPPDLFISGDEAFGTLTQSTTGNDVVIAWTGEHMIPGRAEPYILTFQWLLSK